MEPSLQAYTLMVWLVNLVHPQNCKLACCTSDLPKTFVEHNPCQIEQAIDERGHEKGGAEPEPDFAAELFHVENRDHH